MLNLHNRPLLIGVFCIISLHNVLSLPNVIRIGNFFNFIFFFEIDEKQYKVMESNEKY